MQFLEKVNPSYQELLIPLSRWKILSLPELKKEVEYQGSKDSFYKIIRKLEEHLLIDSFKDSWSNQKFLYLMPNGIKSLGLNFSQYQITRENRFHDAQVTKVCRKLELLPIFNECSLDQEVKSKYVFLDRIPDAILKGRIDRKEFTLAIEVELTQKSKSRVYEIFKSYSESPYVNNVLYIFNKNSVIKSYTKILNELTGEINNEKFLFLLQYDLIKKDFDLFNSQVLQQNNLTTLNQIFNQGKTNA